MSVRSVDDCALSAGSSVIVWSCWRSLTFSARFASTVAQVSTMSLACAGSLSAARATNMFDWSSTSVHAFSASAATAYCS